LSEMVVYGEISNSTTPSVTNPSVGHEPYEITKYGNYILDPVYAIERVFCIVRWDSDRILEHRGGLRGICGVKYIVPFFCTTFDLPITK
jgi:hypothetical protein